MTRMIGNDLRDEFIQTLLDQTRHLDYVRRADKALRKLQSAENRTGVSACNCSAEEASALFVAFRKASRFTVLHFARKFVSWRIERNDGGVSRGMLDFRPDEDLAETRAETVANPYGLQCVLDEVYPPESEKTVSNVYRCFAWCGFSGVPYRDMLELTARNIDFDSGLIRTDADDYPLYAESIQAFRIACESDWFYSNHPNHKNVVRYRVDGDTLLRGITAGVTHESMTRRFVGDFKKARDEGSTKSKIKYETLLKSGVFFRMSETETNRMPADFSKEIEKHIDDRYSENGYGYRLHGEDITEKVADKVENIMYEEYYRWKLAFLPV